MPSENADTPQRAASHISTKARAILWAASLIIIVLGLVIALRLPSGLPYNVRELLGRGTAVVPLILFALALYACFGLPALGAAWLTRQRHNKWWWIPAMLLVHTLAAWLLIYCAVSTESMQDIVGSPVLGISPTMEYAGRFASLFLAPSALMLLAALAASRGMFAQARIGPLLGQIGIFLLFALALWYGVVVMAAATDNLTELMAWNASPVSVAMLMAYVFIVAFSGSLLAARILQWRKLCVALLVVLLLSLPGYLLVAHGTEPMIVKYGKVFSAMQFLLSASREHYVQGNALSLRFLAMHLLIVFLITLTQAPLFRSLQR